MGSPRVDSVENPGSVRPDPAVARARRVVGLYGDPDVTWSIVLALALAQPLSREQLDAAVTDLVARHPHLGASPAVVTFAPDDEVRVLIDVADRPYGDHDSLLRVALSEDGRTLVVAAHHGAVDGLGMLGVASALTGLDLSSSARGVTRDAQPDNFLRRSVVRVGEALFRPPLRLAAQAGSGAGDVLVSRTVEAARPGSAALVAAAASAVRRWNAAHPGARGGRLLVSMGLSRRPGTPVPSPDRDTAYVRLAADRVTTTAGAAAVLAATEPEPAFPETDGGGLAPRVMRLLANRLGSTVLVSNLGRIADPGVAELRFWPVASGPAGFAIGLASAAEVTTVTVRLRGRWFVAEAAERVADLVAAELVSAAQ